MIEWLALVGFVVGLASMWFGLILGSVVGAIMLFVGGLLVVASLMVGFVVVVWGRKKSKGG